MGISIVGYGKMGRQIEKVLIEKKIKPVSIIDRYAQGATHKDISAASLKGVSVVIDFSSPSAVFDNVNAYIKQGVSVVMGTTGWYDKSDEIKQAVGDKIGFIWSGNFSLGVNIFFRIVKEAGRVFNKFEQYDPYSYEIHHNEKQDSPSGTAIMISNLLLDKLDRKNTIVTEKLDRKIEPFELHTASIRGGKVPGTHVVSFDSMVDSIELKHTARNREGFAEGAVLAAQWIKGKKGFFNIDDLMNSII